MIVTLRQWAPIDTLYDQSLDHKLVGQTMLVNISGQEIPGTVVVAKVRPDGRELEVTLELPDHNPIVASFARMVGTRVQHLGRGGAPQAYEALDDLLDRTINGIS